MTDNRILISGTVTAVGYDEKFQGRPTMTVDTSAGRTWGTVPKPIFKAAGMKVWMCTYGTTWGFELKGAKVEFKATVDTAGLFTRPTAAKVVEWPDHEAERAARIAGENTGLRA